MFGSVRNLPSGLTLASETGVSQVWRRASERGTRRAQEIRHGSNLASEMGFSLKAAG